MIAFRLQHRRLHESANRLYLIESRSTDSIHISSVLRHAWAYARPEVIDPERLASMARHPSQGARARMSG